MNEIQVQSQAETLRLVGGALCLDLTNTVSNRNTTQVKERLVEYKDLVAWSLHAGILPPRVASQLLEEARRHPAKAQAILQRARTLREAIYRIFAAISEGETPHTQDLAGLNAVLETMDGAHIVAHDHGYDWEWTADEDAMDQMIYPLARSAADLLVSGDMSRVRKCEGDTCDWMFVDTSKNHTRRWCSMEECGNVAKARRHYRRVRAANAGDSQPRKHQ